MPWVYDQSSGDLFHDDRFYGTGYSGKGRTAAEGRNNGAMEGKKRRGPIPKGRWRIGKPITSKTMGAIAIPLKPDDKKAALGRSGFFIHGNNAANDASIGCIILSKNLRLEILGTGDRILDVIA